MITPDTLAGIGIIFTAAPLAVTGIWLTNRFHRRSPETPVQEPPHEDAAPAYRRVYMRVLRFVVDRCSSPKAGPNAVVHREADKYWSPLKEIGSLAPTHEFDRVPTPGSPAEEERQRRLEENERWSMEWRNFTANFLFDLDHITNYYMHLLDPYWPINGLTENEEPTDEDINAAVDALIDSVQAEPVPAA